MKKRKAQSSQKESRLLFGVAIGLLIILIGAFGYVLGSATGNAVLLRSTTAPPTTTDVVAEVTRVDLGPARNGLFGESYVLQVASPQGERLDLTPTSFSSSRVSVNSLITDKFLLHQESPLVVGVYIFDGEEIEYIGGISLARGEVAFGTVVSDWKDRETYPFRMLLDRPGSDVLSLSFDVYGLESSVHTYWTSLPGVSVTSLGDESRVVEADEVTIDRTPLGKRSDVVKLSGGMWVDRPALHSTSDRVVVQFR